MPSTMVGTGDATVKTKLIQPLHSCGYGLVGKTPIKRVINYCLPTVQWRLQMGNLTLVH